MGIRVNACACALMAICAARLGNAGECGDGVHAPFGPLGERTRFWLRTCEPVASFQFGACFAADELIVSDHGIDGTATPSMRGGAEPSVVDVTVAGDGLSFAVIIDETDEVTLPAGTYDVLWVEFARGPSFSVHSPVEICGVCSAERPGGGTIPLAGSFEGRICDGVCPPPAECGGFWLADAGEGRVEVSLTAPIEVRAFSFGLCHDAEEVGIADYSLEGTIVDAALGGAAPDFFSFDPYGPGEGNGVTMAAVLSLHPPFASLPVADSARLATILYELRPGAESPGSFTVACCDRLGAPPVASVIIFPGGTSCGRGEGLALGETTVRFSLPFKRGDANHDGWVDIGDAVHLVDHLFKGRPIACMDAADIEDNGAVETTDVVALLEYLFRFEAEPSPPGPIACGPDATPDELGCEVYDRCD